jgi:NAD-dependent deacetylase
MEAGGWLKAVITQNIDGLHQRAGSREVLELHGDLSEAVCLDCRLARPADVVLEEFLSTGQVPRCPACFGLMKPSVVFIGEQLPAGVVSAALSHLRAADVLLVAGSSLEMAPASELPVVVHGRGGCIIVVNLTPTYIDEMAEVVIRADVVEALPEIARACRSAPRGLPRHSEASGDSPFSARVHDETVDK